MVWEFGKGTNDHYLTTLTRSIRIKWWTQYDEQKKKASLTPSTSSKANKKKELEDIKKNLERVYEELLKEGSHHVHQILQQKMWIHLEDTWHKHLLIIFDKTSIQQKNLICR